MTPQKSPERKESVIPDLAGEARRFQDLRVLRTQRLKADPALGPSHHPGDLRGHPHV